MFKKCTQCGSDKPLTEFSPKKAECKRCNADRTIAWRKAHPEDVLAQKRRAYYKDPAKKVASVAAWRKHNPEKYLAQLKRAAERYGPAINRIRLRDWKRANKEKCAAWGREYRQANKDKVAEATRRGQAARRMASVAWANREAMVAFYKEARRLTAETGIPHEVDHIVPLQSPIVCGLHCEANMQVLPKAINAAKYNRYWPDMP